MKKMLIVISVLLVCTAAFAQKNMPPTSVAQAVGLTGQHAPSQVHSAGIPAACSPCLWYSGDSDGNSVDIYGNHTGNALLNENETYDGIVSQVWVPMLPSSNGNLLDKHVSITNVTFNEWTYPYPPTDLNGGTYAFRTDVSEGNPGKAGAHGTCKTMTATDSGLNFYGYEIYQYTCTFKKPVKLAVGTVTWVNVLPTLTGGTRAFLGDVEDTPSFTNVGWGDDYYESFFNFPSDGFSFTNTQTSNPSGGCGGVGCDAFSVAVAGTYVP